MPRIKTEKKSALQLAADRVRKITAALENTAKDLKECEDGYFAAKLAFQEAERNLKDTIDFRCAQQNKLEREIEAVHSIICPAGNLKEL
jgi:hypothetical protein